ncbi:MAG: hypothetical protein M1816_002391 [Peltula sp. TS41687]|nr:MAG: hypothetical protein M1816_002391 [Peltula sp. TS41687]
MESRAILESLGLLESYQIGGNPDDDIGPTLLLKFYEGPFWIAGLAVLGFVAAFEVVLASSCLAWAHKAHRKPRYFSGDNGSMVDIVLRCSLRDPSRALATALGKNSAAWWSKGHWTPISTGALAPATTAAGHFVMFLTSVVMKKNAVAIGVANSLLGHAGSLIGVAGTIHSAYNLRGIDKDMKEYFKELKNGFQKRFEVLEAQVGKKADKSDESRNEVVVCATTTYSKMQAIFNVAAQDTLDVFYQMKIELH